MSNWWSINNSDLAWQKSPTEVNTSQAMFSNPRPSPSLRGSSPNAGTKQLTGIEPFITFKRLSCFHADNRLQCWNVGFLQSASYLDYPFSLFDVGSAFTSSFDFQWKFSSLSSVYQLAGNLGQWWSHQAVSGKWAKNQDYCNGEP